MTSIGWHSNLLKELEKRGIANREIIKNRPPRVEYNLTEQKKVVCPNCGTRIAKWARQCPNCRIDLIWRT